MPKKPAHWLIKSEPDVYALWDLQRDGTTSWDCVRNYQARNHLRAMAVGDLCLYYHSNADPSGVAGVARVTRTAYPDPTQFDPTSEYADPRSPPDDPRWSSVEVAFVSAFAQLVSLQAMKEDRALQGLAVLQKGTRLSVVPVGAAHFARVTQLGGLGAGPPSRAARRRVSAPS